MALAAGEGDRTLRDMELEVEQGQISEGTLGGDGATIKAVPVGCDY